MPLYYFHLRDGAGRLLDPLGRQVDDPADLAAIALTEARALMAQDVLKGALDLDQRLEIEDAGGTVIHRLSFAKAVNIKPSPDKRYTN